MQFSEAWLRSFVNPRLDSNELAHVLTMAGLEVESVEPVAPNFSGVVVGQILTVEKHPGADRLRICKVDVGEAELQIVCGAPNAAEGLKVPCARIGAMLPAKSITQVRVRDVESHGMLCSAQELGLADVTDGLMILSGEASVGADLRTYLELDDNIFTIKLTPNRADCLGMIGIAREVAAITETKAYLPTQAPVMQDAFDTLSVKVEAAEDCPLYCGRVIKGINPNVETPLWLINRLARSGIRSVSTPVDITNYVMMELGQPMHAFDKGKLKGGIAVRMAREGESIQLLNGEHAELTNDVLVIADNEGPVALAGIMGGEPTSVDEHTRDVFLESAYFRPQAIAGKARSLGLSTDSSHRFERGVDYKITRMAIERATALFVSICGGQPGPLVEEASRLPVRHPVKLRPERAKRLLGIELDAAKAEAKLARLGCQVKREADGLLVTPPSFRFDIEIEVDLIEELARLIGYETIPGIKPASALDVLPQNEAVIPEEQFKHYLSVRDFHEVITYSFVDPAWEQSLNADALPLSLANPIASQMSVMRTTLWGGLINALRHNLNRQQNRVRLFEMGRIYLQQEDTLRQVRMIGGLCYGESAPEQWGRASRAVDFFDVKGDLENLPGNPLDFIPVSHPALHPGQCAQILLTGQPVGWLGVLHPRLVQHFDLDIAPVLFELELDPLVQGHVPVFEPVPRFPAVKRDLAFVVERTVLVRDMAEVIREVSPPIVKGIALFDAYQGKGLEDSQKSLAFRIVMQDTERTLTDAEVESAVSDITQKVIKEFGATLRS
jgi:phenylalanyl-tRNA synthetase beta chain